jgi:hypothetical protein
LAASWSLCCSSF